MNVTIDKYSVLNNQQVLSKHRAFSYDPSEL